MGKIKNILIAALLIIAALFFFRSCNADREMNNLISQLSEYKLKEKSFETKRLADSSTITTQTQTILSQSEAIKLGMIELNDKMKKVQAQVKQKSEVVVVEKQVPYIPDGWADTTGLVKDEQGNIIRKDSIAVPQKFKLDEKWFSVEGYIRKSGMLIDSLKIPNKTTMTIGYRKTGFLNINKEAVVQIKNDNPYIQITGMDNVVIKNKRPFWKSPVFTILVGVAVGYSLKK